MDDVARLAGGPAMTVTTGTVLPELVIDVTPTFVISKESGRSELRLAAEATLAALADAGLDPADVGPPGSRAAPMPTPAAGPISPAR
jgi:hypothetical protein